MRFYLITLIFGLFLSKLTAQPNLYELDKFELTQKTINGQNYLVDAKGNTFLLAMGVGDVTSKTRALDLSGMSLSKLPEEVLNFPKLEILKLNDNQFQTLPETLSRLKGLKYIILNYNKLEALPEAIGELKNLMVLEIANNKMTTLAPSIGKCKKLVSLNLTANKLSNLPDEIGQITSLSALYLGYNELKKMPQSIGNCLNLTNLTLHNNQLQSLPESMKNLKKVTFLMLKGSGLSEIPPFLTDLPCFSSLSVRNEPGDAVPPEIVMPDVIPIDQLLSDTLPPMMLSDDMPMDTSQMGMNFRLYENAMKDTKNAPTDVNSWHNLSWYALFVGKYGEAIVAAERAISMPNFAKGIYSNLICSYLLTQQFEKAEKLILERRYERAYPDQRLFQVILLDLKSLEAQRITNANFAKARKLLK
jgi:tetratricopeptide (TPR) repeat protein